MSSLVCELLFVFVGLIEKLYICKCIEKYQNQKHSEFKHYLTTDVKIKIAKFKNNAGIIGAAMYARKKLNE